MKCVVYRRGLTINGGKQTIEVSIFSIQILICNPGIITNCTIETWLSCFTFNLFRYIDALWRLCSRCFWKHCDKRRNCSFFIYLYFQIWRFFKVLQRCVQSRLPQICCMWVRVKSVSAVFQLYQGVSSDNRNDISAILSVSK